MRLRAFCPAKVNLFLSVGEPLPNGYHPLWTVFQAVSLGDDLEIETGVSSPRLECDWAGLPAENTLTKALRLYREYTSVPDLSIRLTKRVPAQSGLGGGSSDAAGLLRLIQRVAPAPLGPRELSEIAAAVGADVPFFLVGGRAIGERFGDRLTPLPDGRPLAFAILRPPIGCSTPTMYARLDERPRKAAFRPIERYLADDPVFGNDFESVAPPECLALIEGLREAGARQAHLCGSGSAVFGVFPDAATALRAIDPIPEGDAPFRSVVRSLSRTASLD
ncbi:MAG: 4-(cytidine 5'-diphospho)-2-C-methyl-D-erythritol kinase [Fimbriimonadaceae bacterium]|nr:4-(cytidine 5'-diphospho)-2-C-methyl-D-erythritol kinase [Fimbriimonadaceae bacterium]